MCVSFRVCRAELNNINAAYNKANNVVPKATLCEKQISTCLTIFLATFLCVNYSQPTGCLYAGSIFVLDALPCGGQRSPSYV